MEQYTPISEMSPDQMTAELDALCPHPPDPRSESWQRYNSAMDALVNSRADKDQRELIGRVETLKEARAKQFDRLPEDSNLGPVVIRQTLQSQVL